VRGCCRSLSEANLADIEDAGWNFVIIGGKLPDLPYAVKQWRHDNPDRKPADGMVLAHPTIMGPKADQRRRTTIYQYKTDRARRTLHGIDQQVAKARRPSPDKRRSNGTGQSPSPEAPAPSTGN
jgi:hypothetical protein